MLISLIRHDPHFFKVQKFFKMKGSFDLLGLVVRVLTLYSDNPSSNPAWSSVLIVKMFEIYEKDARYGSRLTCKKKFFNMQNFFSWHWVRLSFRHYHFESLCFLLLKRISNIFRRDSPFWRHSAVGGVLVSLEVLLMVVVVLENLECCNFFLQKRHFTTYSRRKDPNWSELCWYH